MTMRPTTGNQFSTFSGVFTPSILTILGVIFFMRANFVIGQAGIVQSLLILLIAKSITYSTSLSISAVSTNMDVKGGGFYFLISRVLGADFGGTIGITLYFAQSLSVPFYILGFSEALLVNFPQLAPYIFSINLSVAVLLFLIAYFGAGWAIRVQFAIMVVLAIAIICMFVGALSSFSLERFMTNLGPQYTSFQHQGSLHTFNFWGVFAIYFPAVTGIGTGVNMSGDLKDPGESIPRGTLWAVTVGLIIYGLQILICGGSFDRAEMISRPYQLLYENAFLSAGFLIAAGVTTASLSSALGSYLGAPRVMQAVSRDKILPFIKYFGKGTQGGDEPRRALFMTMLVTLVVLVWAGGGSGGSAFNALAVLITMFFLYTYGMINFSAFVESVGNNPSFRPQFKYFHWATALFGALGCLAVGVLIDYVAALIAVVIIVGLLITIRKRELQISFGDAKRGFLFQSARRSLLKLQGMPMDSKNWRPTVLVFTGDPDHRDNLASYGVWLESGRGFLYLADIFAGEFEEVAPRRPAAIRRIQKYCEGHSIQAFPIVAIAKNTEEGMSMVLQMAASGPICANVTILGWTSDLASLTGYFEAMRIASILNMSTIILKPTTLTSLNISKRIDVWWRGRENGSLMLLLAYLLTRNWEWHSTKIRLLRLVDEIAGHDPSIQDLEALIAKARVKASAQVIVSELPFELVLRQQSEDASCVFIGCEVPGEGKEQVFHRMYEEWLEDMPTTLLVHSQGVEDVFA